MEAAALHAGVGCGHHDARGTGRGRREQLGALDALEGEDEQRAVVLGDLAAVEAAVGRPEEACRFALHALDQLERT
ncbi:hypothetical protein [Streptomyces sp. NBC_00647]|uniref:hypothetical protein n=1 Tax=Streptomyces sp. NBC_00647 TaxID=2975796 RepID=UPI00386D6879